MPQYFYSHFDQQHGPVAHEELQRLANAGDLNPDDLVQLEGSTEWCRADAVAGLALPGLGRQVWSTLNAPVGQNQSEDQSVAAYLLNLKRSAGTPWATYTFIAICLGVYLLMLAARVDPIAPLNSQLLAWGASYGPLIYGGQIWRLLTCTFIHIGIVHLALNLWVLADIGPLVERLFGTRRFAALYLLAGILSSVTSILWKSEIVSAGASGAIFGVYGGLIAFLKRNPKAVPVPVLKHFSRSTLAFIGYNLVFGFLMSAVIDNAAHVGGLVFGFLCGLVLAPRRPNIEADLPGEPAAPVPTPSPALAGKGLLTSIAVVVATLAAFYVFSGDGNLGTKLMFGKSELYFKAPVTEAQARKLGGILQELEFFSAQNNATVVVQKPGAVYQIRFVINSKALGDPQVEEEFRSLAERFKEAFDKQPIEIHLCDELIRTKKVIEG